MDLPKLSTIKLETGTYCHQFYFWAVFFESWRPFFRIFLRRVFSVEEHSSSGGYFYISKPWGIQQFWPAKMVDFYLWRLFLLSTMVNQHLWYFFQTTTLNNSKFSKGEMRFFFRCCIKFISNFETTSKRTYIDLQNFLGQTWAPGSRFESSYCMYSPYEWPKITGFSWGYFTLLIGGIAPFRVRRRRSQRMGCSSKAICVSKNLKALGFVGRISLWVAWFLANWWWERCLIIPPGCWLMWFIA